MYKINFLILAISLICIPAVAQMVDVLGGSVVQGQLTRESAQGVKTAMNYIEQNKLISQLNMLIMDIKTHSVGGYQNLHKSNFQYDFGPFDWNIGVINDTQFFIELKNVDKASCNRLVNAIHEAAFIKVNSLKKKDCDEKNNIQFVFD